MFFLKDDSVLEMINEGLRGLWANLCEFIYPKIAEMYSVFMDLSKLIYSDDLSAIYNKISLFLGIFMIFRLSFWLIEALMNPDILGDKAKAPGEMIKKVFLVVVLLGITPSLFKYAYKLQYELVNSNVIGNIISDNKTVKPETKEFGKILSADLFSIFYRPNYDEAGNMLSAENLDCSIYTGTSDNNYEGYYYTILKNSGDLKYLSENRCLREKVEVELTDTKEKVDVFVVDFDGLYAVAVGIFVFWMILMYCISLGARYVQLIFLQVIAPIPIMGYLSTDKDNMFSKWVKQCTTTYLDVFIRIIIINFTIWLISMVLSGNSAIPSDLKKGGMITLFLVLGLLTFAKKAPELIQELLPKSVTKASGDFGLSWKKRTDAMLGGKTIYGATTAVGKAGTAGLGIGALTALRGAAGGRGVGRLTGFVGGFTRGVVKGGKKGTFGQNLKSSWQRQGQVNKQKIDWANSGSTWSGRMRQRFDNALGFVGTAEGYENEINLNSSRIKELKSSIAKEENISGEYSKISKIKSDMKAEAEDKLLHEVFKAGTYGYELQQQVLKAKAILEKMKSDPAASADDITDAENKYNEALKQNKEKFITGVFAGQINNPKISNWREDVKAIVEINQDNAFGEIDSSGAFDNFEGFNGFEGKVKQADNILHRDRIDRVRRDIKGVEDRNAEIQASEEYQKAIADRNAVGGNSGKK